MVSNSNITFLNKENEDVVGEDIFNLFEKEGKDHLDINLLDARFVESIKLNDQKKIEVIAAGYQEGITKIVPSKLFRYIISLENDSMDSD